MEAIDEGTAEPTENESKTADNTAQQLQPVTQDSSKESEPPNVLSETDPKAGEVRSELDTGSSEAQAPPQAPVPAPAPISASQSESHDDDAPRPQSMKDRLAFFTAAQNKPAPPPPVKPKPAAGGLTWSQRQKLRQEQEAKEKEGTAAASPVTSTPIAPSATLVPETKPSDNTESKEEQGAAMSAADALTSISKGGSLKERMAALQGVGAFGGAEKKPPPPPPTGKVWKRPAVQEMEPEPQGETEAEKPSSSDTGLAHEPLPSSDEPREVESISKDDDVAKEEETEEEQEKARRAAIAARMAKLGARGPMGMMPPAKPVKKPTRETTTTAEDKSSSTSAAAFSSEAGPGGDTDQVAEAPAIDSKPSATSSKPEPVSSPADAPATAPPKSIPIPAMPRRTVGPRRRTHTSSANPSSDDVSTPPAETHPVPLPPAESSVGQDVAAPADAEAEPHDRLETINSEGHPVPPKQMMVYDEEAPLQKTEEQIKQEQEAEERGRGIGGLEGAEAAGIAVGETDEARGELVGRQDEPQASQDDMASVDEQPPTGGNREDVMSFAPGEGLQASESTPAHAAAEDDITGGKVDPVDTVPLHPPADEGLSSEEDDAPPPPPRRGTMTMEGMPLDELEKKHLQDAGEEPPIESPIAGPGTHEEEAEEEEEEEGAPLPPPRRSLDRPGGSYPLPPVRSSVSAHDAAPDVPPENLTSLATESSPTEARAQASRSPSPPLDATHPREEDLEEGTSEKLDQEGSEMGSEGGDVGGEDAPRVPPPPSRIRKATSPVELREEEESPTSPVSADRETPHRPDVPVEETREPSGTRAVEETAAVPQGDEEDAARRSGIAARMAKLGGIKFGIPPPHPIKTHSVDTATAGPDSVPNRSENLSPVEKEPPAAAAAPAAVVSPEPEQPERGEGEVASSEEEETPEQEAARRRATLARLRAGGALGFGMFNQPTQMEPEEVEEKEKDTTQDEAAGEEGRASALEERGPPPLPLGRPGQGIPPSTNEDVGAKEEQQEQEQVEVQDDEAEDEEQVEDVAPPPPPARPVINTMYGEGDARPSSQIVPPSARPAVAPPGSATVPLSPVDPSGMSRSPTEREDGDDTFGTDAPPPAPAPPLQQRDYIVGEENEEGNPPPPPPPRAGGHRMSVHGEPERGASMSEVATEEQLRMSPEPFSAGGFVVAPSSQTMNPKEQSRDSEDVPVSLGRHGSVRQGTRPGYDQLKEASATYGQGLAKVARGIFAQGKKGFYGVSSDIRFNFCRLNACDRMEARWVLSRS